MINVAMLSKWHVHANGYAKAVQSSDKAKITCVWDEDSERGNQWASDLGVDFESDLEALLARDDVDAVIVDTPTSDHEKVMIAAANAKKHIFTEKAMAPTMAECDTIAQAVSDNAVKFCISYPNLTTSLAQFAKQLLDDGLLGKIHYMRMRRAHAGSLQGWLPDYWYDVDKAGGGAMMDLGCHPLYTAAYLLGKPKRIASMFNNNYCPPPADDNAVSVVEFEGNAIAVLETSFVSPFDADCFELLGTEGALISVGDQVKYRSNKLGTAGWVIPDKLPEPLPMAMDVWFEAIESNSDIPYDTEMGKALTELLENAYKSDAEQKIVSL